MYLKNDHFYAIDSNVVSKWLNIDDAVEIRPYVCLLNDVAHSGCHQEKYFFVLFFILLMY